MTAEVAMAIRMSANAALDLDKARALLPKRKATKESSEEEEEGTSLITRPRARRRIIIDDEIENTPARTSATEPVLIQSDEDAEPRDNNESIQHLFDSGFGSGELGPVFDEAPLSSFVPISSIPLPAVSVSLPALTTSVCLPISTAPISVPLAASTAPASAPVLVSTSFPSIPSAAPLPSVHHTETGSSSGNMTMRSVTLEVPANHSLLRKTGRADVWLEPLIGDIEKKKMESHSCLTLMNDVVHSTLKANLISTELMRRISLLGGKKSSGAQLEANNWKEQFENAQRAIEELQENKNLLELQKRGLISELATVKASSSQLKRDKELLECSLSEQLSRASEEVRELKALLAKKEEYAGELVQSLTQAQADLQTSSDEIQALKKENFNIEVSWAFLNSRRDALMEAAQEGFDLQSELAKVIDTIEKSQQSTDTPSPALEVPENVAIPASEGETSTTQSMEVETSVSIPSSSAETVPVAASSEVATVPVAESEIHIATSDVLTPSIE
uniref:Dynactin subunit 1-like n=1 Tax=Nicotiana tabacum TaxID=4097 RepID=A0A1S4CN13_TOBAC|nr:PREDICTED: dynactin subunit 1-like [Nicotiana tabacum]